MAWADKARRPLIGLVLAVGLLLSTGCHGGADESGPSFRFAAVDDKRWPLRGNLAEDAAVRAEVAEVVAQWRAPGSFPADEERSAVFWLGELDGTVLGLVRFRPVGEYQATWLLEVTGQSGELAVTKAWSPPFHPYDNPVLAVRSPGVGPRYLVAADVGGLEVQGEPVPVDADGMTGVQVVPECRLTSLKTRKVSTQSRLDLGLGMAEPFYPVIQGSAEAADLWADVDTCAAMATDGWLGLRSSLPRPEMTARRPARLVGQHPDVYSLRVDNASVVDREELPGTMSTALTEYADTVGFIRYGWWLVWTYPSEVTEVELPVGVDVATNEPGLLVLLSSNLPDEPLEIGYRMGGEQRTVTVLPPF